MAEATWCRSATLLGPRPPCAGIFAHRLKDRPTARRRAPVVGVRDYGDGGTTPPRLARSPAPRGAGCVLEEHQVSRHWEHNQPSMLRKAAGRSCPRRQEGLGLDKRSARPSSGSSRQARAARAGLKAVGHPEIRRGVAAVSRSRASFLHPLMGLRGSLAPKLTGPSSCRCARALGENPMAQLIQQLEPDGNPAAVPHLATHWTDSPSSSCPM